MNERLSQDDFNAAGLGGWRVEDDTAIAELGCSSFTAAGQLAAQVTAVCDQQNHHADLSIHYPGVVKIVTSSHDVGGLTDRDLRLAKAISELHPA